MSSFFSLLNDDLVNNILSRLPAKAFCCAACVNKHWYDICSQILKLPKLSVALSLHPAPAIAVREVLDKILAEPIRPHFAIAFVSSHYSLEETQEILIEELGVSVPVITNTSGGIIGPDFVTNQIKEMKLDFMPLSTDSAAGRPGSGNGTLENGISLVVGFFPGLRAEIVPFMHLRKRRENLQAVMSRFIMAVRSHTLAISADTKPAAIIFFGDHHVDLRQALGELDYAMPEETIIVGDANGVFLWKGGPRCENPDWNRFIVDGIALVFAREPQPSHQGTVGFHLRRSTGIIPFGPRLVVVYVGVKGGRFSVLVARLEDGGEILDGWSLLEDVHQEIEDEIHHLYIGVNKSKQCSTGYESSPSEMFVVYYEVIGSEQEGILVSGTGINPGDVFLFYHSDSATARSSSLAASHSFSMLASSLATGITNPVHRQEARVFGGLVFAGYGRNDLFYLQPDMDGLPIYGNFPGAPVGGMFGLREIGRPLVLEDDEIPSYRQGVRCPMEINSTIYLAFTYRPPLQDAEDEGGEDKEAETASPVEKVEVASPEEEVEVASPEEEVEVASPEEEVEVASPEDEVEATSPEEEVEVASSEDEDDDP